LPPNLAEALVGANAARLRVATAAKARRDERFNMGVS
jgi:hypothetical protein